MSILMSLRTARTLLTRTSAVAMIADRTAYDVRYTGKLSNRFRLGQAYERLVRTIRSYLTFGVGAEHSSAEATVWAQCAKARSDSTGRIYERTETPSTQA